MPEYLKKIPTYSSVEILSHSRFKDALLVNNRRLVTIYRNLPRYSSSAVDMRRWMMMQAIVFLHFSHRLNPSHPALTASQLCKTIATHSHITYSTASNFLKSMENSGYIQVLSGQDARTRTLRLSPFSERIACLYSDINLRSLDVLDNGGRHIVAASSPSLLISLQPLSAQALMNSRAYCAPPFSINTMTPTTVGVLLLNELTRTAPGPSADIPPLVKVRVDSLQMISLRYQVPESSLIKLLDMLRKNGHYGENPDSHWISGRLLIDYYEWQAAKLACISRAFIPAYKTAVPAAAHLTR